ncbi:MAG: hypothetical protein KDB03_01990 [Planctomycetales bacterium]|nr:hypothetical protein [Planctomycetales bacterium]
MIRYLLRLYISFSIDSSRRFPACVQKFILRDPVLRDYWRVQTKLAQDLNQQATTWRGNDLAAKSDWQLTQWDHHPVSRPPSKMRRLRTVLVGAGLAAVLMLTFHSIYNTRSIENPSPHQFAATDWKPVVATVNASEHVVQHVRNGAQTVMMDLAKLLERRASWQVTTDRAVARLESTRHNVSNMISSAAQLLLNPTHVKTAGDASDQQGC